MGITRESTVTVVSSLAGLRSLGGGKLMPSPQRLGDRPRLGDAPAWCKRRIAIEDLGDRPEPVVAEVMRHWREEGACRLGVAVHLEVRERERAEEERPHRALMISAVAVPLIATVMALVLRVAGRKTPEPVGRQEMAGAGVDDLALAFEWEWALAERDCEDLVWPERVIVAVGRVDDVVTTPDAFIPEATESRPHARGEFVPWPERQPQSFREAGHRAERVVPERVDLDRLAGAWRDDPVTHLRVHPGELDAGLARPEEAVGGILLDPVARALTVEPHDLLEHREQLFEQPVVSRRRVIGADRLDVPEGRVHGVVLRRLAGVGKSVRQHPTVHEPGERRENPPSDLRASGRQRQARQRDHRVASPVAEPVVAGDDGHAVGVAGCGPSRDELVAGEHEVLDPVGGLARLGAGALPGGD